MWFCTNDFVISKAINELDDLCLAVSSAFSFLVSTALSIAWLSVKIFDHLILMRCHFEAPSTLQDCVHFRLFRYILDVYLRSIFQVPSHVRFLTLQCTKYLDRACSRSHCKVSFKYFGVIWSVNMLDFGSPIYFEISDLKEVL